MGTMPRLYNISILPLSLLMMIVVVAACDQEAPLPSPDEVLLDATQVQTQAASPTFTPTSTAPMSVQTPVSVAAPVEMPSECTAGQVLGAGDSCIYPGTSEEFRIDEDGIAHFLVFTANVVINARNALIEGQAYDFATRKQSDGRWVIEVVGDPLDVTQVSDLLVSAVDTATVTSTPAPTLIATPTPNRESVRPTPAVGSTATVSSVDTSQQTIETVTPIPTPSPVPTSIPIPPTPVNTATDTPTSTPAPVNTPSTLTNRPPQVVAGIPAQTIMLYESLVIEVAQSFDDPDGNVVGEYSLILSDSAVAHARINSVTGQLTLTGAEEGSSWVTLTACDAISCSNMGDLMFLLTVEPLPNRPPQAIRDIEAQTVRVGESVSVYLVSEFWDFEGDSIVDYDFRISDEHLASGAINLSEGIITFVGSQVGTTSVSVTACDDNACSSDKFALNFSLVVEPLPNRSPEVLGSIPNQKVLIGESVAVDVSNFFSDPDGDEIKEYRFSHSDRSVASAKINSESGILTLKGLQVGTTNVAVEASDGVLASDGTDLTFALTVEAPPGHPPTVIGSIDDQDVELDESIDVSVRNAFYTPPKYRITRYDFLVDEGELAIDSDISPDGILTLNGAEEGKSRVSVRACNSLGCSNFRELSFVLVVSEPDEDEEQSPPEVIGGVNNRSLMVGESITFDVSAAFKDPDDDPIVEYKYILDRVIVARGSSISNTGVLRLQASSEGTTKVAVVACDEEGCSDPDHMSFTLTVEKPRS